MKKLLTMLAAAAASLAIGVAAQAGSHEGTLLTVTGKGDPVEYDRAALEALGSETITTTTIWTEGVQNFTGVPLHVFVESLGLTEGTLLASAVNDYTIQFPVADALQAGPMIAYLLNGEPMSVRDKGPLWIVYPYDSNPDFQSEIAYSRSIWQLNRIEVTP